MEDLNKNDLDQVSGGMTQNGNPKEVPEGLDGVGAPNMGSGTYTLDLFCNNCGMNVKVSGQNGTQAVCPECGGSNFDEAKYLK